MRKSTIALVAANTLIASMVSGVDFESDLGFAPRLDSTFTTFVSGTLKYTPEMYSSLSLVYDTEKEKESESANNLTTTQTTKTSSFSVDFDVFGLNTVTDQLDVGIAASIEYIRFGANEELLYDADDGLVIPATGTNELLLTNDRSLNVFLPTVDVRVRAELGLARIRIGGEYSPAVFVSLEQTADSDPDYPGFTDNGPVSTSGNYQSGQSFSLNGSLRLDLPFVTPSITAEYTHLPIEYKIAAIGGEQTIDTLIRNLTFDSIVGIKAFSLFGFYPTVRVRYDRSWTEIDGADDVVSTDEWLVYLGMTRH